MYKIAILNRNQLFNIEQAPLVQFEATDVLQREVRIELKKLDIRGSSAAVEKTSSPPMAFPLVISCMQSRSPGYRCDGDAAGTLWLIRSLTGLYNGGLINARPVYLLSRYLGNPV
jgi:hypothetical protein